MPEHCTWYIGAFYVLSPSRMQGFGNGGILISEMMAYAAVFGVQDREQFVRIIQALDGVYLAHTAPKEPEKDP